MLITLRVGEIELEVPNERGEYVKKTVDLFAFTHGMLEAGRNKVLLGDMPAAAVKRAEWLAANGFPDVTPTVAAVLLDRLWVELEEVKKKGHSNGYAGTPGRSDSPSSTSGQPATRPD